MGGVGVEGLGHRRHDALFDQRLRVEAMIEEIKHLRDTYGVRYITFHDDLFIANVKRLEARPVTTLCIDCKTLQEKKEKSQGQ